MKTIQVAGPVSCTQDTHRRAMDVVVNRLLRLPLSPAGIEEEIKQHIEAFAFLNGLHLDIHAMIRRRSLRLHLNQSALPASSRIDTRRPKWIRLPDPEKSASVL